MFLERIEHHLACIIIRISITQPDRPVGWALTRSSLEREVRGSNLGPVKSDTMLPTARHLCDISSKGAVLPTCTMTRRWAPPTRYTLRRITASIMKDLIFESLNYKTAATATAALSRTNVNSETSKFFNTGIYTHLLNLQWQETKPSPLRVWVRFFGAAPAT